MRNIIGYFTDGTNLERRWNISQEKENQKE
jgi:hypothetical protein